MDFDIQKPTKTTDKLLFVRLLFTALLAKLALKAIKIRMLNCKVLEEKAQWFCGQRTEINVK